MLLRNICIISRINYPTEVDNIYILVVKEQLNKQEIHEKVYNNPSIVYKV